MHVLIIKTKANIVICLLLNHLQGVFIKRCHAKKPDGTQYTYKDIMIGADLPFFGRIIHIVDCDDFTRTFLEHEELTPNASEPYPIDPIDVYKSTYKKTQTGKISCLHTPWD